MLLLQLVAVGGLVAGTQTLFLRDVMATHLPMKVAQASWLRAGELPLLDPQRAGGQPLVGNPNVLPLYPDNALFLVAPPLWALNAHFWLHFLLAPWSAFWLGRRLGLGRQAAWVSGVLYALSGWFLGQLAFYNLVAGAALAPALAAAFLAAREGSRRAAAAGGLLWALLLLAGEPSYAALALLAATLALVLVPRGVPAEPRAAPAVSLEDEPEVQEAVAPSPGRPPRPRALAGLPALLAALALGTLLAAPQIVETLRILPTSTRGARGYDLEARTLASWDPRTAVELLVPFPFGRVDRIGPGGYWGHRFHPGGLPFFLALHPGLLCVALAALGALRRGPPRAWALALCGAGVFVALGRFNPLLEPLLRLPGADLLRFPIKAWMLVALGLAALGGAGWERVMHGADLRPRRVLGGVLLAAALLYGAAAAGAFLARDAVAERLTPLLPKGSERAFAAGQPERWAAACANLAGVALLLALAERLGRTRPALGGATLLAAHAATQLLLLAPGTMPRDAAAPYRRPPPFAELVPPGSRVAHGGVSRLFGAAPRRRTPDGRVRWLARQGGAAGYPMSGAAAGWRYELATSPEGLDAFLSLMARDAVRRLRDPERLRLLRLWGVEWLLLERPLAADASGAHQVAARAGPLAPVLLYRLDDPLPEARLVFGVVPAAAPREALRLLLDPAFDPGSQVVLAGGEPAPPGRGSARFRELGPERLLAATDAARPGWLVVERAWQPLWKATVDGRPAAVVPANLHRMAVSLPAGRHEVRLAVDRRPLRWSAAAAALAALGLVALAGAGSRRRSGAFG